MSAKRLLVIDDDSRIARLIADIGTEAGYLAAMATSSSSFVTLYHSFHPDVCTLDVMMPEMDAFEVLHYMQKHDCRAHILLISGSSDYRDMAYGMGLAKGLDIVANIRKPFRVPELRAELAQLANKKRKPNLNNFAA